MIRRTHDETPQPRKRATRTRPTTLRKRSRATLKRILENALRPQFPTDTVDVSDGYKENIHILVVSRKFDGMMEQDKQDLLWGLIDKTDLRDDEQALISLVLPLSPAQLK